MFKDETSLGDGTPDRMPTISECRTFSGPMRDILSAFEEQTSRAYERARAGSTETREARTLFARGATTSLLSIAAGLIEIAASRQGKPFDDEAFDAASRDCAEYVAERRSGKSNVGLK